MKIILRGIMKGLYKYILASISMNVIVEFVTVIPKSQGFEAIVYFILALFFLAVFIILLSWIGGSYDDR